MRPSTRASCALRSAGSWRGGASAAAAPRARRPTATGWLGGLAQTAAGVGPFVRLDMEDSGRLPSTLGVFDRVWDRGIRNVGIALQAYLYRTPDAGERYGSRGGRIRLCKGAHAGAPP